MRTMKDPMRPWRRIPKPSKVERTEWAKINDSRPPYGQEAEGQFNSFLDWVNNATSWIGGTGAKCFDTLDRPCRCGADFERAQRENTFPIRWYLPHQFAYEPNKVSYKNSEEHFIVVNGYKYDYKGTEPNTGYSYWRCEELAGVSGDFGYFVFTKGSEKMAIPGQKAFTYNKLPDNIIRLAVHNCLMNC